MDQCRFCFSMGKKPADSSTSSVKALTFLTIPERVEMNLFEITDEMTGKHLGTTIAHFEAKVTVPGDSFHTEANTFLSIRKKTPAYAIPVKKGKKLCCSNGLFHLICRSCDRL